MKQLSLLPGIAAVLLALISFPGTAAGQGRLDNGGNVSGEISSPLQIASWIFDANAGDGLFLRIGGVTKGVAGFFPSIRLLAPDGRLLGSGGGADAGSVLSTAPTSGTYTVLVFSGNSNGAGVGTYTLTLAKVPGSFIVPPGDEGGTMSPGAVHTGSIHLGDLDPWTFRAEAGSRIALNITGTDTGSTAFSASMWLFDPNGVVLFHGPSFSLPLTVSGTYTAVVASGNLNSAGTGTYQLTGTGFSATRAPMVDLNGDGRGDAFLYNLTNGAYSHQLSNGAGGFASRTAFWDPGWQVYPVNLNTDALTDFFLYDPVRGLWVQARNNAGDGTFTYTSGTFDPSWQIYPADLDGNGVTDVFVYNRTTGLWAKCFVSGSGDFSNFTFGQWDPVWTPTTADLNGDGRDDFLLYNRTSGVWVEAFSQAGLGTFDYPAVGQWDPGYQITAADLNGDTRTDLFLLNAAGIHVSALSRARGDFDLVGAPQWTPGWSVYPGDFNRDGRADLFLYNAASGVWVEALSNGLGDFTFPGSGQFDPGWTVGVTDLNADGRADVVVSNGTGVFVQLMNMSDGGFNGTAGFWGVGWRAFLRPAPDR